MIRSKNYTHAATSVSTGGYPRCYYREFLAVLTKIGFKVHEQRMTPTPVWARRSRKCAEKMERRHQVKCLTQNTYISTQRRKRFKFRFGPREKLEKGGINTVGVLKVFKKFRSLIIGLGGELYFTVLRSTI